MPSKNTKIISIRVPNRVDFSAYNAGKLIACFYDMIQCGAIKIEKDEIILPDESDGVNLERLYEVCHEKNIDPQKALDTCIQRIWR